LIYLVNDRWLLLAAALALGVLAKETAIILIPGYWIYRRREGRPAWLKTAALAVAATVSFSAARLPLGWHLQMASINGARDLMIWTNLGIGPALDRSVAPAYQNYLQPLLFIGIWLPAIAWNWRRSEPPLHALCLWLTILLLASNLCFGWMYESRNYLPLVPLLVALSFPPRKSGSSSGPEPEKR
jgi:hypothetical protein